MRTPSFAETFEAMTCGKMKESKEQYMKAYPETATPEELLEIKFSNN